MPARRIGGVAAGATALVTVALLAMPLHAGAHSVLTVSAPAAGAVLGAPPGDVVLEFSEPLQARLSSVTVTDPGGHVSEGGVVADQEMRVPLVASLPGTYRVDWTTVSSVDGHVLHGTLTFAVQERVRGTVLSQARAGGADAALAAARALEDAALIAAGGMFLVGWLARRSPRAGLKRLRLRPVLAVALAAGVAVVALEAALASNGSPTSFWQYLATTQGALRVLRLGLEAAAVVLVVRVRAVAWALVLLACLALAAAGHAAVHGWPFVAAEGLHLVAAGVWAGGIVALAAMGRGGSSRELLRRFTPYGLGGFGVTVLAGLAEAVASLGGPAELWTTAYGRTLLLKGAGVAGLVVLSLAAWRLRRPRLRLEAAFALCVVIAGSVLGALPLPGHSGASAGGAAPAVLLAQGLPGSGALTLARPAGQALVALSLTPGRSGPNRLVVSVVPGSATRRPYALSVDVDGLPVRLRPCGADCGGATVTLRGGERLVATAAGPAGGHAVFQVPPLPAAGASARLGRALAMMAALRSVRLHERLSGGAGVTLTTDYVEAAPGILVSLTPSGAATVTQGTTRHVRAAPGAPWTVETGQAPLREPAFAWQFFGTPEDVRSLGSADAGGITLSGIAFFTEASGYPVWFELWLDGGGLVRLARMTAPGHFMVQAFSGFDAPVDLASLLR